MTEKSFKYHKYMIKSAPYGEQNIVIENLQKISPFDLNSQQCKSALQQYNQEHLALLKLGNQNIEIPIFKHAKDQNGLYLDQFNKKMYQVNHSTLEVENLFEYKPELTEEASQLLDALSNKLKSYIDENYKEPNGHQVFISAPEGQPLTIHLAFCSKNVEFQNFSTGEWNSVWLINKSKIEGRITIRSHVFQSCNVQMNQEKTISKQFVLAADMQENANKIIKIIQKEQNDVQTKLSDLYNEIQDVFFKNLRRIIPVTKKKMEWNTNALKMINNLHQVKK